MNDDPIEEPLLIEEEAPEIAAPRSAEDVAKSILERVVFGLIQDFQVDGFVIP